MFLMYLLQHNVSLINSLVIMKKQILTAMAVILLPGRRLWLKSLPSS